MYYRTIIITFGPIYIDTVLGCDVPDEHVRASKEHYGRCCERTEGGVSVGVV